MFIAQPERGPSEKLQLEVLGTAGLCLANSSLLIHTFPAKSTPEASRMDNQ